MPWSARTRGKEQEAESLARKRFALGREAFRGHRESEPGLAPTDGELAAQREAFKAALAAKRRAKEIEMRDAALEAFKTPGSGAAKNLALMQAGELQNVEYLVKAVLAYYDVPIVRWEREWKHWKGPVLEAGAIIARQYASPRPDDWLDHPLECACPECLCPHPSYARPWQGATA